MPKIDIYTTQFCPYCVRAKKLLQSKGASYNEIRLDQDPSRSEECLTRSNGGRTVPQIFIGDLHVGGCDDLYELERQGKLDTLLA